MSTGGIFKASWPVLRPSPWTQLRAEAEAAIGALARQEYAVLTGPPRIWLDRDANRVRAEAPAKPGRCRKKEFDDFPQQVGSGPAEGRFASAGPTTT